MSDFDKYSNVCQCTADFIKKVKFVLTCDLVDFDNLDMDEIVSKYDGMDIEVFEFVHEIYEILGV